MSKPIPQLLKEFAKQPGCDAFSGDTGRIKLMEDYLWLRQLTPSLPFETFLDRYAAVADHNDENCKHPAVALDKFCPRHSKTTAVKNGARQWNAKEAAEYTSLYIDMIREAEETNQPIPMTFAQFLPALTAQFLNGDFAVQAAPEPTLPAAPSTNGKKRKGAVAAPVDSALVTPLALFPPDGTQPAAPVAAVAPPPVQAGAIPNYTVGQLVVHRNPVTGKETRGHVQNIAAHAGRTYLDFKTLEGAYTPAVAINAFRPATAEEVNIQPTDLPPPAVASTHTLWIPKAQFSSVTNALAIKGQPMGSSAINDAIFSWSTEIKLGDEAYMAAVDVVNGESGPYVDAHLIHFPAAGPPEGNIVAELPPRDVALGEYYFQIPNGGPAIRVDVKTRT